MPLELLVHKTISVTNKMTQNLLARLLAGCAATAFMAFGLAPSALAFDNDDDDYYRPRHGTLHNDLDNVHQDVHRDLRYRHTKDHKNLNRKHSNAHDRLDDTHDYYHDTRYMSRREHDRLHRSLKSDHNSTHRNLDRKHNRAHDRNDDNHDDAHYQLGRSHDRWHGDR